MLTPLPLQWIGQEEEQSVLPRNFLQQFSSLFNKQNTLKDFIICVMYSLTPTRKSFKDPDNGGDFYMFFHIF